MRTSVSVLPTARIEAVIGRRDGVATYSEQRAECIERIEAAVEPKRILVEIRLKMLRADPMVTTQEPAFQVRKHQMDDRQVILRERRVSPDRDWKGR